MINSSKIDLAITSNPTLQSEKFSIEHLFPQANPTKIIPSDIIKHILNNFITFPTSLQMIKLNRSWHALFNNNQNLYITQIIIPSCINTAICSAIKVKNVDLRMGNLFKIVKIDPLHIFTLVKNLVKPNYLDDVVRSEITLLKPKSLVKEAILEVNSKNFKNAMDIAQKLVKNHPKLFCKIFSAIAKFNPEGALKLTNSMPPSLLQVQLFIEISKLDPKHDLTLAKNAAHRLKDSFAKLEAFIELSKVDFEYGLNCTKEYAKRFPDYSEKFLDAQFAISKIDRQSLPSYKEAVLRNPNFIIRDHHFSHIAVLEIPVDLALAKATATLIGLTMSQATVYRKIIKVEAQENVVQAEQTLNSPDSPLSFDVNYIELAKAQQYILKAKINLDFTKMKQAILQEQDPLIKSRGLLEVVKIEIQKDIKAALETANSIPDPEIRAKAYIKIANFAISLT